MPDDTSREGRPEPTRTTIVGGQPAPTTRRSAPIPQGLESLLQHAAANPRWRKQLRRDPVRAAERARIPLTDNERLILAALPPEQLDGMIAGYETTRSERRGFLKQAWAAAVGLLLGAPLFSGCHHHERPGPVGGARPDIPDQQGGEQHPAPTRGIRPDVPESGSNGGEEKPGATQSVRPDGPAVRSAGVRLGPPGQPPGQGR